MEKVRTPCLIIHGRCDLIIPWQHGEELWNLCKTRKLFINPHDMEHNTNLTSDISFLIVPMFRFFALPDYSFKELNVPSWLFDKRRSPLYEKPDIQVASHGQVLQEEGKGCISLPKGDESSDMEFPPVEPITISTRISSAAVPLDDDLLDTDSDSADDSAAKTFAAQTATPLVRLLTHPTVRHCYSPTKQMKYQWNCTDGADPSASPSLRGLTHTPQETDEGVCQGSARVPCSPRRLFGSHASVAEHEKAAGTKRPPETPLEVRRRLSATYADVLQEEQPDSDCSEGDSCMPRPLACRSIRGASRGVAEEQQTASPMPRSVTVTGVMRRSSSRQEDGIPASAETMKFVDAMTPKRLLMSPPIRQVETASLEASVEVDVLSRALGMSSMTIPPPDPQSPVASPPLPFASVTWQKQPPLQRTSSKKASRVEPGHGCHTCSLSTPVLAKQSVEHWDEK
eukprot:TRINITY_DN51275_c0_g1_i1.p1 TRINITY_DN51275_c0_g1~~TRINITY_DN51275_c0_g1_i1.p1  ORF type:complete len:455 (+),score=67.53 TRINITY_DN51275_c0_g1_i1:919-2283(+)